MAAVVRDFRPTDRAALIALWRGCGLVVWYNDPDADLDRWLASPAATVLVADDDGVVCGGVCVGHDGHRGWLYYLAVDAHRRKQGIGRMLVRAAESWLLTSAIDKVQLMVRPNNREAIGFYGRMGYVANPSALLQRWLRPAERPGGAQAVTSLQSTAPPPTQRPSVGARVPLALMRLDSRDGGFFDWLQSQAGPEVGSPAASPLTVERHRLITQALVDVLYVGGAPAGYFALLEREKEIELLYCGLTPSYRHRGLGRYLLRAALDAAWMNAPSRVWARFGPDDEPRALALLQWMGMAPWRQEPS